MIHATVTKSEAMDIIDAYGPDADWWPDYKRKSVEDLIASDDDFAGYVSDAKRIDDMLSNWDESADGASINTDELFGGKEDDFSDDGLEDDFSDEDEPEDSPGTGSGEDDEEENVEEDDRIIEVDIDPSQISLSDMDGMISDFLRKEIVDNKDDSEYVVFTRDFDVMVVPETLATTPIEPIEKAVAKSVGPLMKDLRRMIAAKSQVKRTPGMRSGRLHAPNLHRIMSGDDRVFTRRQEANSLDTAISLVLDCSGSMSGERMLIAAQSAFAIGSVLHRLGISFECLGFTTAWLKGINPEVQTPEYQDEVKAANRIKPIDRSLPIIMPQFKTFDERWNAPVHRRFAQIHNCGGSDISSNINMGSTPEGCGNDFAARRLLARKEARKIMITMTDGEPGTQNLNFRQDADIKHARNTVQAITKAGIDIIGVGIQHSGPTAYYPNAIVINSINDLPKQLLGLLKKLLVG